MSIEKIMCSERRCSWHGYLGEILTAPNPFEEGCILYACPECKGIDSLVTACDEPDCWKKATCGTPTKTAYRRTCDEHYPNEEN